jgi:hypothetical protein
VNRRDVGQLLAAASEILPWRDFVIVGSLSILGTVEDPPADMVASIDVDLYPRDDPAGAGDLGRAFGLGSAFEAQYGIYADPVSPVLATLPEGWENRLVPVDFGHGVTGWFREPHDAAVSKYARAEPRDLRWIRAGLDAGLLQIDRLDRRLMDAIIETDERQRARSAFAADRRWVAERGKA